MVFYSIPDRVVVCGPSSPELTLSFDDQGCAHLAYLDISFDLTAGETDAFLRALEGHDRYESMGVRYAIEITADIGRFCADDCAPVLIAPDAMRRVARRAKIIQGAVWAAV